MKYSFTIYISVPKQLSFLSGWWSCRIYLEDLTQQRIELSAANALLISRYAIFLDGSGIVMSSARRLGQSPMMTIDYRDYYYCFGSKSPTVRRSAFNSAAVEFHPTFLFVVINILVSFVCTLHACTCTSKPWCRVMPSNAKSCRVMSSHAKSVGMTWH